MPADKTGRNVKLRNRRDGPGSLGYYGGKNSGSLGGTTRRDFASSPAQTAGPTGGVVEDLIGLFLWPYKESKAGWKTESVACNNN